MGLWCFFSNNIIELLPACRETLVHHIWSQSIGAHRTLYGSSGPREELDLFHRQLFLIILSLGHLAGCVYVFCKQRWTRNWSNGTGRRKLALLILLGMFNYLMLGRCLLGLVCVHHGAKKSRGQMLFLFRVVIVVFLGKFTANARHLSDVFHYVFKLLFGINNMPVTVKQVLYRRKAEVRIRIELSKPMLLRIIYYNIYLYLAIFRQFEAFPGNSLGPLEFDHCPLGRRIVLRPFVVRSFTHWIEFVSKWL